MFDDREERSGSGHWVTLGVPGAGTGEPPNGFLGGEVEERLARLAAAMGPLRRVLAALAARMVESRGYERLCYARLSDYARERPGLSSRQLQELARVHRALEAHPALERALLANALSWSKVRLVARVATAEDVEAWIARGREVSARRLEREVAERRAEKDAPEPDGEEAAPSRQVGLRCTPAAREWWSSVRELAERAAGQSLSAGDALELVLAEAASALSLAPDPDGPEPAAEAEARRRELRVWESAPAARAEPRPTPEEVRALAAGLEGASAHELDRRLQCAVRLEQTLAAAVAPLLRIVRCAEYEWTDAYRPLSEYAPEQLGMSASKARALLRIERAGDACAELREAWQSGRLSWVKAQCLAPLLRLDIDGAWRPIWVAWAERVTARRLAGDVERALLLQAAHPRAFARCLFRPERAQDPVRPAQQQTCAHGPDPEETERLSWRLPPEVAVLFVAVREAVRRRILARDGRLPTDGRVFEELLAHAQRTWTERPPGSRRPDPVIERDGYRCAVPGCTSRRNLQDHHIVFRSAQGSDAPENRVTLCAFHHHRCLHAGRMRVSGRAPDGLVFELGVRPDGPPLARYRSGDVALAV